MKILVRNCDALDNRGAKIELTIPISRNEEPALVIIKGEYDRLDDETIAEIQAIEPNGYFVLKLMRILKGWKLLDMAKLLGISEKTYKNREDMHGNEDFTLVDIHYICNKFKMSADTLFFTTQYFNLTAAVASA